MVELIQNARKRAFAAANKALIDLYWQVGEYISRKLQTAEWGEGVVNDILQLTIRGFTRPNLFRMRQFYETYRYDEKVSSLVRQFPWTHNLLIMSHCKQPEESVFYLHMCLRGRWTKRVLERQLAGALFEQAVLSPPKASAALKQLHPDVNFVFNCVNLLYACASCCWNFCC